MKIKDFFPSFFKRAIEKEKLKQPSVRMVKNSKTHIGGYPKAFYENGGNGNYLGGFRSGGAKWAGGLSADGGSSNIDHWRSTQNARSASLDSPTAKGMMERRANTVVGSGLKLDSMPDVGILGITDEQAEAWARDVESRWSMWAKDKTSSRSELFSFNQIQKLHEKCIDRDGESFLRLYYSADKKLMNPVQVELIDKTQIRGDAYTSSLGPFNTEDGITRDDRGREKEYKIWIDSPNGGFKYLSIPRIGEKSGRRFMIHSFEPEFPGQKRGFTQFFHVLQEFENLVDFTSSTIKKAINASSRVFAVVNEQQDPSNPEEDAPKRSPIGPGVSVNSPSVDPVESATPEITNDYEWCEPPEVTDHTPGSTSWLNLAQGDKPFLFPNADNETFGAFVDSFVSYLASSKNMPVEVLKMQFNANYSASRASLVMFYNQAKIWREQMATDMLNIVFEMWLTEEIAAGRVSAPGWSDPILKKAWLKAEWYGSPMPNIDPKKESEAQMNYLKMSATTQDRVARETNGSSAESNISKNKKSFSRTPTVPWEDKEITEDPMEGENG